MTVSHETRAHARLGASSAYRWTNCPGSYRLTDGLDTDSVYAAEGTAAHQLAETLMRPHVVDNHLKVVNRRIDTAFDHVGDEIIVGNHVFVVDEEMAEAVQLYVDTLLGDTNEEDLIYLEQQFQLDDVREGLFGTNDFLTYRPSLKRLRVYDYKHGTRRIEPHENKQLLYYALGAALNLALPLREVELVIVQPRAYGIPVRRWSTDMLTLVEFMDVLGDAVDRAREPNAPLIAGPWCRESFCPASGTCPAYRAYAQEAAKLEFAQAPTQTLSDEALGEILDKADAIRDWVAAVFAEATRRAEAGEPPPGWRMVPKRAMRRWMGDPDALVNALRQRFKLSAEQVLAPPKLKSPAQLELVLPKRERGELAEFYEKVSSGSVLAREGDPRDSVERTTALEDFGA